MVGIIYYGAGNIFSLQCALDRIGIEYLIIREPSQINLVDKIIIPGVGHAEAAMRKLNSTGLIPHIQNTKKPLLGICLGMQLLTNYSEEGNVSLLNLIPVQTKKINAEGLKVPQIGWNTIRPSGSNPLFQNISTDSYFYFVHSYAVEIHPKYTIAITDYWSSYSSAIQKDNFFGVQFHPEKSGAAGELLLANFNKL